jgi:hypothetical protein
VSNVPSCRLIGTSSHRSDSEDPTADPILAYGDCEGVVSIFSMIDLKLVSSLTSPDTLTLTVQISKDNCHDFPVTGLAVAPRIVLTTPGPLFLSPLVFTQPLHPPSLSLCSLGMDLDVRHVIVSCSADNKLSTILLRGSSFPPPFSFPHSLDRAPESHSAVDFLDCHSLDCGLAASDLNETQTESRGRRWIASL